ncbi:MAG TPA: hypothetical protein VFE58_04180 [Tepidisphaeraceae bacterium]|nr:hypothetical protein [Tepidisphaeraceae bacterium]
MKFLLFIVVLLLSSLQLHGADLAFSNDDFSMTLTSNGDVAGLSDKSANEEWARKTPPVGKASFATVHVGGRVIAASDIVRHDDVLTVRFGKSGIEADYRVTPRKGFILLELLRVRGGDPDEIVFAQLPVKNTQHGSGILNAKWNEHFTICLMALDDKVQATFGPDASLRCIARREFGLSGHKVALIAVPTPRFYEVVQEIEHEFGIPHASLGGQWAKTSPDVRRSYLFIDLTEKNADEVIRLAKLGGFGAILTYSGTWAASNGSYLINTKNFPRGEESLKAVADKCHAAGLKMGIHMLTSFVAKNDPLVHPKPDPRLLCDSKAVLGEAIDAGSGEIVAAEPLKNFPGEASFYGERGGMDVQIDDEIVHYSAVGGVHSTHLLRCTRGAHGTVAASHKAGTPIRHLAERYNSYLVDLRSSLKDELADRIAGVINRCGLDMIYFDGGEVNDANGPSWYWVGVQQSAVFSRVKRDLLVQGSGMTHWTWHFYSRGTCDDFAALAPKEFLDYHKIADSWQSYHSSFLPAELGWWGFFSATPDHPATTSDDVEFYATRMIALDSAVSLETTLAELKTCKQSEQLLGLLGDLEKLRLGGRVAPELRNRLKTGEWHWSRGDGDDWQVQPIRYDTQRVMLPATMDVTNGCDEQPLQFRMRVESALAPFGDKRNITLMAGDGPTDVPLPAGGATMPGALAHRVSFAAPIGDISSALMVGAAKQSAGKLAKGALDLTHHRALAVQLEVQGSVSEKLPAVLNIQLESEGKRYRDYYIDLNFNGKRIITLPGATPERMLPEFRPNAANYPFKLAGYTFNYGKITAINLRWMRLPQQGLIQCRVKRIEAIAESDVSLHNPKLSFGGREWSITADLHTGDYAEFYGGQSIRIFDDNGAQKEAIPFTGSIPLLKRGSSQLRIDSDEPVPVALTSITVGAPIRVKAD